MQRPLFLYLDFITPLSNLFHSLKFLKTVNSFQELPSEGLEVAFVGRSNSGKSSAINTLANRNHLAFVSKAPGRTQYINYFDFGEGRRLVDLPGYGYAQVPSDMRAHWKRLLSQYLSCRPNLVGLLLVMDVRRPLMKLDRQMLEWLHPTGKPVHCLLTKSDKLARYAQQQTLQSVKSELSNNCLLTVQLFSSLKKQGVPDTVDIVSSWFDAASTIR